MKQYLSLLAAIIGIIYGEEDLLPYKAHNYFFERTALTWHESNTRCIARGGSLVTFNDLLEWNFVKNQAVNWIGIKDFWIGLNDIDSEGSFKWISGEAATFTNFYSGEPNNNGANEDCVHTFPDSQKWNDVNCALKKQSICEMSYNVDLLEYNGNKYYFGTEEQNFILSYLQCSQRGGHLVSFANEAEWRFVTREATVKRGMQSFWIGLGDYKTEGKFEWNDDLKSNFRRFASGEPNQAGEEDCVVQLASGHWNDIVCNNQDIKRSYVCKIPFHGVEGHYSFFTDKKTWDAAQSHCRTLGANLVTIDSKEENSYIFKALAARELNTVWLGINDKKVEENFEWVNGATSCYRNWKTGEPNDHFNSEDCSSMIGYGSSAWNDLPCSRLNSYVCEF